ncbi:MAG: 16S rRNA (cytosine(1402)-N(4))-methyltransferase RsmH [Eubacteriales bacterium]|nr:16S rRNA (cytosine(1402)-N(4))-methyltransferase RsmH [Eubacteriales bacterium]MDD4323374.1 16S rRNA (cytosine(1402)-N(4))-methyltransferase RsmH [Eubacteriales bacterium]
MVSADYSKWHRPVLLAETIEALALKPDGLYVDVTSGGGGHSAAILSQLNAGGRLIAMDRDEDAREETLRRLESVNTLGSYSVRASKFSSLSQNLLDDEKGQIDGLLADLGTSSHQLDEAKRGFSYHQDGPLDMRMDQSEGESAADLLAAIDEHDLVNILRQYGEETHATRIARAIVTEREHKAIETTAQLAEIILRAVPASARRKKHPARRSFQAIRIAVNREFEEIESLLNQLPDLMSSGGRVVIISFHSLEDRLVKRTFSKWEDPCECPRDFPVCVCGKKPLGKRPQRKVIEASEEEIKENSRARSAKLRVFEFGGSV